MRCVGVQLYLSGALLTKLTRFLGVFYIVFWAWGIILFFTNHSKSLLLEFMYRSPIEWLFILILTVITTLLPGYLLLLLSNRLVIKYNQGGKENTASLKVFYYLFFGATLMGVWYLLVAPSIALNKVELNKTNVFTDSYTTTYEENADSLDGKKIITRYYKTGKVMRVLEYIDQKATKTTFYYNTGEVKVVGEYVDGKKSKTTKYHKNGEIKNIEEY
jgi:hypothetical protein